MSGSDSGGGCPLMGGPKSSAGPSAAPKLMAPALLVVPDSSPLTRRRWSSGGVISPRSPVTPREFRGGGGLSPDLLSADRPETPEGERLDLRAIGAAVSALLAPNPSAVVKALRQVVSDKDPALWDELVRAMDDGLNAREASLLHDELRDDDSVSGVEDGDAQIQFLLRLAQEVATITGLALDAVLESAGEAHASSTLDWHGNALRFLGGSLADFLVNLESLHVVLERAHLPLRGGRLSGVREEHGRLVLQCASRGEPLLRLLAGTLRRLASQLFQLSVRVSVAGSKGQQATLVLQPEGSPALTLSAPAGGVAAAPVASANPEDLAVSVATFCRAFPFHFMCDRQLKLTQLGMGLARIFGGRGRASTLPALFTFVEPRIEMRFDHVVANINLPFLLQVRDDAIKHERYKGMEIKGQMVHCPESRALLFLGSPVVDGGLSAMLRRGLYISDVPVHDATRDILLVEEQSRAQDGLKRRMDKIRASIQEANLAVEEERQKNVDLLHLIFPPRVARKLWLGESVEAQQHDQVTLLFSDIVGFTAICSTATPMMVINMLNALYTQFDQFCGELDVYKIETVGDAYCVASGLRKQVHTHAQQAAWMALKMMAAAGQVHSHDGKPIQMRIGLHTGLVLAGVVGVKMPRYCLIGNDVSLANKFESGSIAMHINVSPTTHRLLVHTEGFRFEARPREYLPDGFPEHIKGTCHFLKGFFHPKLDPAEPLDVHIRKAQRELRMDASQTWLA
ncbi:head-specific guanylate cyclase [Rhipicephalus sanguineus]|uniref:head-specific guanylate cyclase n=1 Tax=Rhipicephalus sanguineus TaxID=34632 RepID=UPI001893351C|nr:head-specific guanylate cyclase [Rhipicephalus sanguineus]XP_037506834.1 head-specific guanylate cyclase [Rhipicephalus sanguineus]